MERECLRSHNIHLVIHYDPVVTDDPELNALRDRVARFFAEKDERMTIHDFRMIRGSEHTDLIFDAALPAAAHGQEKALKRELEACLNDGDVTYHAVITFDPISFNP